MNPAPMGAPKEGEPKGKGGEGKAARLLFEVPAEAKIYIDGQLMKGTDARRSFVTPNLDPRETYFYDVKIEVARGGKPMVEERQVVIRAGDIVTTAFDPIKRNVTVARR
jgi:uncharacterized protein (TIGR03000 family)